MATLVVTEGPAEGQMFALGESRIVMVGRDHNATFQVLDPRISRFHFQIKQTDDGHTVVDYESSNGVLLNGAKIEGEARLQDHSLIQIGNSGILYITHDDPDAQTLLDIMRKRGEGRFKTELDPTDS